MVKFFNQLILRYTFDLRAFALMRICIALVVLLDLCIRLTDLEAHYTNHGILPLKAMFEYCWNEYHFSFHAINGMWQFQLVLFLISIVSASCLLLGFKTKTSTFISWILMCSLHSRNSMILQGGDDLLRMCLFWGLFLPWQRFYSIDGINDVKKYEEKSYHGIVGIALMLQIAYVYFFSGLQKSSPEWHQDATALYYALSFDQILLPLGKVIYFYPELLKTLTQIVIKIEVFAPFLFFIPVKNNVFRSIAVFIFIAMHIGITSILFVGLFSLIGISTQMAMLPSFAMDWFDKITNRIQKKITPIFILFAPQQINTNSPSSIVKNFSIALLIWYISLWNIGNTNLGYTINPSLRWFGHILRLDQNWGVFAPGVIKDDGWYILEATTIDDRKIDIYRNGMEIDYKKPKNIVSEIKNDRWRKYGEQMMMQYNGWMRGYYCNYVTRKWNESHPENHIKKLEIVYMLEFTQPDYKVVVPKRESLNTCGH